jgi:hypothetical protein
VSDVRRVCVVLSVAQVRAWIRDGVEFVEDLDVAGDVDESAAELRLRFFRWSGEPAVEMCWSVPSGGELMETQ